MGARVEDEVAEMVAVKVKVQAVEIVMEMEAVGVVVVVGVAMLIKELLADDVEMENDWDPEEQDCVTGLQFEAIENSNLELMEMILATMMAMAHEKGWLGVVVVIVGFVFELVKTQHN